MNKHVLRLMAICCLGLISIGLGCQPTANTDGKNNDHGHSHDHSDTPKSLSAAITELEEMWDQIRTAMDEDDPQAAHEPLHEVGQILKAMPDLAADTDLSEDEWQEVKEHADKLFKSFSDIDSTFHKDGDKQAAYDAAKSAIHEGIEALEAKLPMLGESGHGHDHHDHKGHDDDDHDDEE